jgi:hypothetical protein
MMFIGVGLLGLIPCGYMGATLSHYRSQANFAANKNQDDECAAGSSGPIISALSSATRIRVQGAGMMGSGCHRQLVCGRSVGGEIKAWSRAQDSLMFIIMNKNIRI